MKKLLVIIAIILIVGGASVAYMGYVHIYQTMVPKDLMIQIPTGSEFDEVIHILDENQLIKNVSVFQELAERMNYIKSPMRSGQFELKEGMGTYDIIRQLRNGPQKPTDLIVNINWTYERAAARISNFVELDSFSLVTTLNDPQLQEELEYNTATAMTLFIPNTYEVYWNTSGADLIRRLHREKKAFWGQNDRTAKAAELGMTRDEVYTLASIVERETNQDTEKQRVAGVYL
ncbi:MAG: endolytic transglycosylase MltG, partial [Bacteroidia bacterium]|nr:endolytic transglycosylase MltG [Bacteroidia bacterium]